MNILALIAELVRRGFQLSPRGDKLAVAPANKLTPELTEILKTYKPEILRLLRSGLVSEKEPTVLYHQDPDPCSRCGRPFWWINSYYVRVCQTCHPAPSSEVVLEWLEPREM